MLHTHQAKISFSPRSNDGFPVHDGRGQEESWQAISVIITSMIISAPGVIARVQVSLSIETEGRFA